LAVAFSFVSAGFDPAFGQEDVTPLQFLKAREAGLKGSRGDVYIGKVMTLFYPAHGVEVGKTYPPFLLELTDVLKTPLRKNYRLVLKGFSDSSGDAENDIRLSRERAESLKALLMNTYYMNGKRITIEARGNADPIASNETLAGRSRNRRVEIHVYGDISEAVRFLELEEEGR
jgi:hypothetical protein